MIRTDDPNVQGIQRHCMAMLDQLGVALEPEQDPALHLMRWSIDTQQSGLVRWQLEWADGMLEQLDLFRQDIAPKFLWWEGEEVSVNATRLVEVGNPVQVAQILMQSLHLAMAERIDNYSP